MIMTTPFYFLQKKYLESIVNKEQLYRFTATLTDLSNKKHIIEKACVRFVNLTYYGKINGISFLKATTKKADILFNQKIQTNHLPKEYIYAFDNVDLGINEKGEIVNVFNLTELQKQWQRRKSELEKYNVGYELDSFFNTISTALMSEENAIAILNLRSMFGMYFHGLFGSEDINEMPKKRIVSVEEFDVPITEEIWVNRKVPALKITAQKCDNEPRTIISNTDVIKKYEGELTYSKDNQLLEGILEIESNNMNIKYNILWVG